MKKIVLCLSAISLGCWPNAAFAQFSLSGPNIRWEEWHASDYEFIHLTGHFIEYCNGSQYIWGGPDIYSEHLDGNCGD